MDVGFWLDEFPNVKMSNNFDEILATCRSRGIYCVPILQSLAQLKILFAEGAWEGVIGNCDTFLYLGGNEVNYVNGRKFSDAEIRLLSDSVLYSPCIEQSQAETLFKKIGMMSSKYFAKAYDYIRHLDVVNRTDNKDIFQSIQLICDGIKKSHQVSFCYQKKEVCVSPYYFVFCSGYYYLLCNNVGEDDITQYRVDGISCVQPQDKTCHRIETLQGIDEMNFNLGHYMKQHPGMTAGELVRVVLLVMREHLETVRMEFFIESVCEMNEIHYKVHIRATKTAICNWIMNMTGIVTIHDDYGTGVKEIICEKAREILEAYE